MVGIVAIMITWSPNQRRSRKRRQLAADPLCPWCSVEMVMPCGAMNNRKDDAVWADFGRPVLVCRRCSEGAEHGYDEVYEVFSEQCQSAIGGRV